MSPTTPARYWKDGAGMVHLEGIIKGGALEQPIFTLPATHRPAQGTVYASVFTADADFVPTALGLLEICGGDQQLCTGDGAVILQSGDADIVSLHGVSFRAR